MITESEYLEAKEIVDEYERQQWEEKQGVAEQELNDWDCEEDCEGRINCVCKWYHSP